MGCVIHIPFRKTDVIFQTILLQTLLLTYFEQEPMILKYHKLQRRSLLRLGLEGLPWRANYGPCSCREP